MAKTAAKKAKPAKKAGKAKKSGVSAKNADPISTFEEIKGFVTELQTDLRKFVDDEVKASGRRARASAMLIRRACGNLRKEIQAIANDRKGK